MVTLIFKQPDGTQQSVQAPEGLSIMEVAIKHNINGIEADCGGGCSCATCHVYIDNAYQEKTGTASPAEEDMLDFAFDVRPQSRLSCQVRITSDMDNIVIQIPDTQV
jgi:ferredoxin, 2Fe-2S